jgi:hypothetical protein
MNSKYLFLFCLLGLVIAGCSKESLFQPQSEPEEFYTKKVVQTRAVLYVDPFQKILGDLSQEDSLLEFCKAQEFKEINLYSVGKIVRADISEKSRLNSFVGKAHSYGLKVNFVVVSVANVNDIGTYCANYSNKPDGIITEYEFWNIDKETKKANSFETFKKIVDAMTDVHNTYPSISRNAYVDTFIDRKDPKTSSKSIIQYLINNCETIFLVNYYANAYNLQTDFKAKLHDISKQALSHHKVANIIVLFNVNRCTKNNIFSYFSIGKKLVCNSFQNGSKHPFKHAYNNLIKQYNPTVDIDRDGLSMKGYGIFRYTDAREAKR